MRVQKVPEGAPGPLIRGGHLEVTLLQAVDEFVLSRLLF